MVDKLLSTLSDSSVAVAGTYPYNLFHSTKCISTRLRIDFIHYVRHNLPISLI